MAKFCFQLFCIVYLSKIQRSNLYRNALFQCLSYNLPVTILIQHKLVLRNLRLLYLIIKEFHSYFDFHIFPVRCKDRIYQFRIKVVPADRLKHIPRYIVGKFFFCGYWIELKKCFQKCGSVVYGISVCACICFWCLRLIV